MSLFKRERVESRTLTKESLPPVMVGPTFAGADINERNSLAIGSVWSCVRCLVDASILTPLVVYRRQPDSSRQRVMGGQLVNLLERPAPAVTGPALMAQLMQHLTLWGECFIGKIREGGVITALEALSPDRVMVQLKKGVPVYTYYGNLGQIYEDLGVADVIHVRGMTLDGIRGASPITVCRETFGLASALTTASSSLWANGAVPSGLLKVAPGPSAQDQAQSLATAWSARHEGPQNKGRIAVVTGSVEFQPVSMSLADAEFIATNHLSLADVARIFGIPPSRVNAQSNDSLTYSTTEAEGVAFVTHALGPRLTLIERAISADTDLCSQPVYAEFLLDALLRGDSASRAAFYTAALNPSTGWMTRDEVRERENLAPLPKSAPVAAPAPPPQLVPVPVPHDALHGTMPQPNQEAA